MLFDFYIKRGDLEPAIEAVLRYANGNPVNLTGATVAFIFKKPGGAAIIGAATIEGAATLGAVKYSWVSGDTDTKGLMIGYFKATIGGRPISIPNFRHLNILVHEDLG